MTDVTAVKSATPCGCDRASRVCLPRNGGGAGHEALAWRTNPSSYPLCLILAGMFSDGEAVPRPLGARDTGWRRAMSQQEHGPALDGPLVSPWPVLGAGLVIVATGWAWGLTADGFAPATRA